MANYYDKVLEDFDLVRESEGALDEFSDEAITDFRPRRGRSSFLGGPLNPLNQLGRAANFGRHVASSVSSGGFATKAELRNSLNSISEQVNELKKTSLSLAGSIKRVDDTYESVIKSIARKDKAQDKVKDDANMMSMFGALINKPKLKPGSLTDAAGNAITIADDAVEIDLVRTMLFTMMPSMMSGSGGSNDMMPLMMVMLLDKKNSKGNDDSTMMLMAMMMMMKK